MVVAGKSELEKLTFGYAKTVRLGFPIRTHRSEPGAVGGSTIVVSHIGGTNSFSLSGGYPLRCGHGRREDRVCKVLYR